jgi:hypothetical protein
MNTVDCPVAEMLTVVPEQVVTVLAETLQSSIHNLLTGVSWMRVLTGRTAVTGGEVLERCYLDSGIGCSLILAPPGIVNDLPFTDIESMVGVGPAPVGLA